MKKMMITNFNKMGILMMSLLMSMAVLTSCGEDEVAAPATVNAAFTSEVDLDNSFIYTFTSTSTILGIDDIAATYSWDFGGDGTADEANPVHTFSAAGDYEVSLTVTAVDGVAATASSTISVTAPKNKWVRITDDSADDTGELRYDPIDSIRTGKLTFLYRVPLGTDDVPTADGFINVSGTSTSGDDAVVEVRIKDNAPHEFREGASDAAISAANFPDPKADVWVPVEVSWSTDGTTTPTFTVIMDGQTIIADATSTTNGGDGDVPGHLEATKDGVHTFQWKYGGNSSINFGNFDVDDIVIYSSDSGSEVVVFSDDFQGYQANTDLDPDQNAESVYVSNSFQVIVAEEE